MVWASRAQRRHSRPLGLEPNARRIPRRGSERRRVALIGITSFAVCGAPLVALAAQSFSTPSGWSTAAWTQLGRTEVRPGIRLGIDPLDAVRNSVENALWATLFAVVIGALASLAIAAARNAGRILDVGMMLPVGTSAVTIGFGMLITFDQAPYDWRAEWWLVPVGHALVAVPFVVRATVGVLRSVDPRITCRRSNTWGLPDTCLASRGGAVPLAPAEGQRRTGCCNLVGRVRCHQFPVEVRRRDRTDRHRTTTRANRVPTPSARICAGHILAAVTIALVVAVDRSHELRTLVRPTVNRPD